MIIIRTLRRDIANYNSDEDMVCSFSLFHHNELTPRELDISFSKLFSKTRFLGKFIQLVAQLCGKFRGAIVACRI